MLPVRITAVDKLLFASDLVAVGSFRCPANHALFRNSGPASNHLIVFPRTATVIRHAGGRSFLADPTTVTVYNRHQEYERSKASYVDASDWYAVADDVLVDVLSSYDPHVQDRADRPFRFTHAHAPAALYAEQRLLFERLSSGEPLEALQVEESVFALLQSIVRHRAGTEKGVERYRGMRERVETARRLLTAHLDRQITLRQIARVAGCSPFTLSRAFHSITGMTIAEYRSRLRLNISLDRLRTSDGLTPIAYDLGFSSHSHFTMMFRREFGVTPSEFRAGSPLPRSVRPGPLPAPAGVMTRRQRRARS